MKNKLLTALMCVAIATALWLYVVTTVSPNSSQRYSGIQLKIQGETALNNNGYILMTDEESLPTVTLNLEGNRVDLNKINSSNITVGVNVGEIDKEGTYDLHLSQPSFPGNNALAFAVLDKEPAMVTVVVDKLQSKTVPVEVRYLGKLPENYMADKDNRVVDIDKVRVSGPKTVVDQITTAFVDVDLEGLSESIDGQFPITLCDRFGEAVDTKWVEADYTEVSLQMNVVRVKEVELIVNVVDGGGATKETSTITLDTDKILVSGSDTILDDMESIELGTINLGEMLKDETLTFPIKLPEGVTNETGVTEANVDVKFPDLEIKNITVTDIQPVNVPEGLEVQLITKRLDLQLRGPKRKMKSIQADDITVTVDFSNEQAGNATVKAVVAVNVDGVGAVGTYNVTATLKTP